MSQLITAQITAAIAAEASSARIHLRATDGTHGRQLVLTVRRSPDGWQLADGDAGDEQITRATFLEAFDAAMGRFRRELDLLLANPPEEPQP